MFWHSSFLYRRGGFESITTNHRAPPWLCHGSLFSFNYIQIMLEIYILFYYQILVWDIFHNKQLNTRCELVLAAGRRVAAVMIRRCADWRWGSAEGRRTLRAVAQLRCPEILPPLVQVSWRQGLGDTAYPPQCTPRELARSNSSTTQHSVRGGEIVEDWERIAWMLSIHLYRLISA